MVSKNSISAPTLNRRQFIQTTAFSSALISGMASGSAQQPGTRYSLIQDGKCIPIEPLQYDGLPVDSFYDYRTPDTDPSTYLYASFGTESLQRKNSSILFLYKGANGLSLVIVHDKVNSGGSAGAVTFRMSNLPFDSKWVVKDDNYDAQTNYDSFDLSKHRNWDGKKTASSVVHWTWQTDRSDGGILRGLSNGFKLKINPAFNEKANLWNEEPTNYEKLTTWEVLSGNPNNPTRTKLKMNKPITIQSEPCPGQTPANSTKQEGAADASKQKETTTPKKSPKATSDDGGQSFFGGIVDWFASLLSGVVSFFANLF
ncbi:hypothetical protein [Haladaptatus caseinilyticus]|uniref:hypothetical protein n=1 Tax=Haladaptatus caseinilyticus TaxID=2993314 RepID=UPI00224B25D8|nr:hypothetical protein [Haladaptatus caseinilyticus]